MRVLSIRDMRANLGDLDEILSVEGEILIVRHGKPVARILPVRAPSRASHAALRARIAKAKRPKLTVAQEIRADRNER